LALANNDFNWRLVAAVDIAENQAVIIDANGKAALATTTCNGVVPQAIKAGERAPVIRGGTLGGLSGMSAGARLRVQANSTLGTGGANPVIAVVKSEDAATAVILSGALDS